MDYRTAEIAIIAHGLGVVLGAGLMYFILRLVTRLLLKNPPIPFTHHDIREWIAHDHQIKELNSITRANLDKLSSTS